MRRARTTATATLFCVLATAALSSAASPIAAPPARAILSYPDAASVPADTVVAQTGATVLYRFAAIPAIVAAGTRASIERARVATQATQIEWDHRLRYMLDTATIATGAREVWGDAWLPPVTGARPPLEIDGQRIDGTGVVIGVVDTGINGLHPDLWYAPLYTEEMPWTPKVLACVSAILSDLDSNPYCDQSVGHGTHVAGIAAGTGWVSRNGVTSKQYVGVAPGAQLVGAGLGAVIFVVSSAVALDWMYSHVDQYGIRVVTNSWGPVEGTCAGAIPDPYPQFVESVDRVIARLIRDKNVTVIFSGGNYDGSTPTWSNPRSWNPIPGLIGVANYDDRNAGTRSGRVNASSADGCVAAGGDENRVWTWPDVSAPGTSITSTASYTSSNPATTAPPFYLTASGTSMAAPHVAGIVALMIQANAALTPAQIEEILIDTATPWRDSVTARTLSGSEMWGSANATAGSFVDRSQCFVTPADAANPAGATAKLPYFDRVTAPDRFVCRDFKRGAGLVDAYAAVQAAIALR